MKEGIGKSKLIHSTLQRKLVINKNVIYEEKHIANAICLSQLHKLWQCILGQHLEKKLEKNK